MIQPLKLIPGILAFAVTPSFSDAQSWLDYPVNDLNGRKVADTGEWMGQFDITSAPWAYSFSLRNWTWIPTEQSATSGAWVYVPMLPATASENTLLLIEMESIAPAAGWELKTEGEGAETITYFEWLGQDSFNAPGRGLLQYPVQIETAGTYRFTWRNRVGFGDKRTEHNDSWLRVLAPAELFAVLDSSTLRPRGICTTDCPRGAGADGWFKVYCSKTLEWSYSTNTSDKDSHQIFIRFPLSGTYYLQVSGRSRHHQIDRMMLERVDP